jgi:ubiquinone/menaquinone biosynthesis C-methylase UbiE
VPFTETNRHRDKNRAHWSQTLDPQNLAEGAAPLDLETQLELAATADVERALAVLEPLRGRRVLDLGGGLGLQAVLLARRGARVIVADLSAARLREARRVAAHFAVEHRIWFVCCAAEEIPFRDGSLHRQITKSVLIHTDLPVAAAELERTLAPGGRACFIEPLSANPFVWLYRRISAPRIWQEITRYFNHERVTTLAKPFRKSGARVRAEQLYFLGFLATPFNYSLHRPRVYRAAEKLLLLIDRMLYTLFPFLRRLAWFCLIIIRKRTDRQR